MRILLLELKTFTPFNGMPDFLSIISPWITIVLAYVYTMLKNIKKVKKNLFIKDKDNWA